MAHPLSIETGLTAPPKRTGTQAEFLWLTRSSKCDERVVDVGAAEEVWNVQLWLATMDAKECGHGPVATVREV